MEEEPLAEAYARYQAAKKARSELERPDREIERRLWHAILDAIQTYVRPDNEETFPAEMAAELGGALDHLLAGEWPEQLKALRKRGPTLPGGQKARYVEDAIRYVIACRERIIPDTSVEEAVKEIAYEYEVSTATAAEWVDTSGTKSIDIEKLSELIPHDLPADLIGSDAASRIDALMRRSGYYFRIWPRLP